MSARTLGVSRCGGFASAACAALLFPGCGNDATTTLAELAMSGYVYVALTHEHVACRCPGIQLIGCASNCTRDITDYVLRIARERPAGGAECPRAIDATARATGGAVGEVDASFDCGEARYLWTGKSPPTQITIEDGSATWTIRDPFEQPSLNLIAPAPEELGRGVQVAFEIPGVELRDPNARITPAKGEPIALDVAVEGERAELTIPDDLPAGMRYDLHFGSATQLLSAACQGPPACRALAVVDSWPFSVPADPIRDDDCSSIDDTVCADGLACYIVGPRGETQCLSPGTLAVGEPCEVASDCVAGAGCHGTAKQCYELCEVQPTDERSTCPAGQRCSWLNAAGQQTLGACADGP